MPGLDAFTAGVGQTDQRDARHAVGGLLALQGPTPLDVRTGVLVGPGSSALITGTTKTGPKMSVQIGIHVAVTSRGTANGAYLGPTLEAPLAVDVDLAPASGSRIDVVYVKQRDMTPGIPTPDASPGPEWGVLTGQVSTGTPAKPDLSTIVGAMELGTVTVAAGATSTNGAGVTITPTVRQTVARGGILPVADAAERTALSTAGGAHDGLVVVERNTDRAYEYTGSTWRYLGGGPPPTTLVSVNVGWAALATSLPRTYVDGSGLVHVKGVYRNAGQFAINATQYPITLPAGARPATDHNVALVVNQPGIGFGLITGTLQASDGRLRLLAPLAGVGTIPAGSDFFLDGIAPFHPTAPGNGELA